MAREPLGETNLRCGPIRNSRRWRRGRFWPNGRAIASAKRSNILTDGYAELSTVLTSLQQKIKYEKYNVSDVELAGIWTANNNARNYMIIDDPAVRLPISAKAAAGLSDALSDVTYDSAQGDFSGNLTTWARTRISLDGDVRNCIYKPKDQDLDQTLWAIHADMIQRSKAQRDEMLKTLSTIFTD